MKKNIALLAVLAMLSAFTGCGSSQTGSSDAKSNTSASDKVEISSSEEATEAETESIAATTAVVTTATTTTTTFTVTTTAVSTEPVTFDMMIDEEPETDHEPEVSLSISDQVIGRWKEYRYVDPDKSNSYNNGWIYDFKLDGTVDVIANGEIIKGSTWRISGLSVIINNIAWYGLDYDVSIVNGEMSMYNAEYGLTFYCKKCY